MRPQTKALLDRVSEIPEAANFVLVGGTALAYHLCHRESEDLDFATAGARLNRPAIRAILNKLDLPYAQIVDARAQEEFALIGDDVDDVQQNYEINGTKVTFFTFGESDDEKSLLENGSTRYGTTTIAGVDSLFQMKSLLLTRRLKSRDLYDLFYLTAVTGRYSVADIFHFVERFKKHYPFEAIKARMFGLPLPKTDEGYELQNPQPCVTIDDVRGFFADEVARLERMATRLDLTIASDIERDERIDSLSKSSGGGMLYTLAEDVRLAACKPSSVVRHVDWGAVELQALVASVGLNGQPLPAAMQVMAAYGPTCFHPLRLKSLELLASDLLASSELTCSANRTRVQSPPSPGE